MNREIKFRAWNIEESKMFSNDETAIYAFSAKFGEPAEMSLREINRVFKKNDHISWMQFTGLKDKNGKEIYEGDILSIEGEYTEIVTDEGQGPTYSTLEFYEVIFENGAFCIKIKEKDGLFPYYSPYATLDHLLTDEISNKDIKVCGNIHENTELLEEVNA